MHWHVTVGDLDQWGGCECLGLDFLDVGRESGTRIDRHGEHGRSA